MTARPARRTRHVVVGLLTLALAAGSTALTLPAAAAGISGGYGLRAQYVALGDSYASGEGLAPYEAGTDTADNRCHRSVDDSYPEQLEGGTKRAFDRATSRACSGAITASVLGTLPGSDVGPQVGFLTPRTRTVTMTIGGNDVGFVPVLRDCIYFPVPDPQVQALIPGRPGCRGRLDALVSARIANLTLPTGLPVFAPSVSIPQVLTGVTTRAPRATIFVSTYPQLLGDTFVNPYGCQVGTLGPIPLAITADDGRWIREKGTQLNAAIAASVAQARAQGRDVQLVGVDRVFDGHNLCDSGTPWLNPVTVDAAGIAPSTFHPAVRGQQGFADAFEQAAVR